MRLFGDVERHALILRSHLDPELRKASVQRIIKAANNGPTAGNTGHVLELKRDSECSIEPLARHAFPAPDGLRVIKAEGGR
jgi:hypothetical protein